MKGALGFVWFRWKWKGGSFRKLIIYKKRSMEYIGIIIAILALWVAFWQWFLSKQQLEEAKKTKWETEKLLSEISNKIIKIEAISDETRKDVKEQISKMIDKNDENFKTLLNSWKEIDQNQLMTTLLPALFQNPDWIENIMKLAELWNKR